MRFLITDITPPFDFKAGMIFVEEGDPQIEVYSKVEKRGHIYLKVVELNKKLVLLRMKSTGSVDKPALAVELLSESRLAEADALAAERWIRKAFYLDQDMSEFYKAISNDAIMSGLASPLRGARVPSTASVFEALVCSIAEQQISLRAALAIERRIIKRFGEALHIGSEPFYAFPKPAVLAAASVEELKACGLSTKKAEYIKNVSGLIDSGELNLDELEKLADEEIIDKLTELRGIGRWTAELTMVRSMHRFAAIPANDLGLRSVIGRYYFSGRRATEQEARSIAENWGCWKGYASYYLILAARRELAAQQD